MTEKSIASVVRQVRLTPELFARVEARCAELKMPVATYISHAVARSLGPVEGMDTLFKDLSQLRDLQEAILR